MKTLREYTSTSWHRFKRFLTISLILLLLTFVSSIIFGSTGVLKTLDTSNIIFQIRFYRTITGLNIGIILGITGLLLQTMLRNPLVDPYILGISSGAALGSIIGIFISLKTGLHTIEAFSFIGAVTAFTITYTISRKTGFKPLVIILSGIMVSTVLSSIVMLIILLNPFNIHGGVSWVFGQLQLSNNDSCIITFIGLVPLLIYTYIRLPQLRHILLGDEHAKALGINVIKIRNEILLITSWSIALSAAPIGPIGFVGLIIPHISRILVGGDLGASLLLTIVLAPTLLLAGDIGARTIFAPSELPVGIIMSLIGAPFFLYLLLRVQRGKPL